MITDASIRQLENQLTIKKAQQELLRKQLAEAECVLNVSTKDIEIAQKVVVVFQKASEYARQQMKHTIEEIVTNALQVVFGREMRFVVELGTRAGAPIAEFFVVEGDLKCSPMDAKGGGLVDVISTAMRLAVLELYEPRIEGAVLLDEPGKMVSSMYAENFAYFLKEYCHKAKRQIIMVTHNLVLAEAGDKTFRVSLNNGVSEVESA